MALVVVVVVVEVLLGLLLFSLCRASSTEVPLDHESALRVIARRRDDAEEARLLRAYLDAPRGGDPWDWNAPRPADVAYTRHEEFQAEYKARRLREWQYRSRIEESRPYRDSIRAGVLAPIAFRWAATWFAEEDLYKK